MPRSGSTLTESIIAEFWVFDLGEINALERSFKEWKKTKKELIF